MKFSKDLNNINKFIYLYLFIFFLLFCYTFYRAEFIHNGKQLNYYYKYYLIFLLNILFWFLILLFANIKKKKLIIILASSFVFLLYFYETVRFFSPEILNLKIVKIDTEQITKLDVIKKIKNKTGNEVYPSFLPKLLIEKETDLFPLSGIANVTTVFCKESEEFSVYKSDRYGFNNSDEEWKNKEIFWFLIGDSFTQGSCVKQNENFASQIKYFDKKNTISLGMAGNGPLLELASLKEYTKVFKPKKVLWFYFERNDLSDLSYEKSNPILMNYLKENFTQNLYSRQKEVDKKIKNYIEMIKKDPSMNSFSNNVKENFYSFKNIIRLKIIRDKISLDRGLKFDIDPLFKRIISNANNFVKKFDGKLYFVYLPDKERYSANKIDNKYLKKNQVINMLNDLNIPIIDVDEDFFRKHNDPLSFYAHRVYGHYSPEGYSQIAKFIVNKINKSEKN